MSKKILIVEDEPDILKMTQFRIKKAGYDTVVAMDGQEALNKAESESPDLILLDYKLPIMDGVAVYLKLKEDAVLSKIPVVFLTASRGNMDLIDKMNEIGAKHSIIKPYDPEELIAKVKQLVGE